jgi:acetyl esterase
MTLDPQVKTMLDQLNGLGAPPMHTLPVDQARAFASGLAAMGLPSETVAAVDDTKITSPAGGLAVRLYRPEGEGPRPALVYLHGSGWMYGDLEMSDTLCRRLARVSGCIVVAPDYRLAPEHPYPAALEDVAATLEWVAAEAGSLGIDPARLAIGSESAGGNLAAAAALWARDRGGPALAFQLLICPVLDAGLDTASMTEFADGYLLTRDGMAWLWGHYLTDPAQGDEPYASPLRASSLAGLPPALIVTAGYDPLRDEAEAYGARLVEAGIAADVRRYGGMIHGFFTLAGVIDAAPGAIDETALALAAALGMADGAAGAS